MGKIAEAYIDIDAKRVKYDASIRKMKADTNRTIGGLQKNWNKYGQQIGKVGLALTGLGVATAGALTGLIAQTVKAGDQLDKMSKRTGISVETLSELKFAAEIAGTNIGVVEKSTRFLSRTMDDFARGVGEAKDKFIKYGISVVDSNGKLRGTIDVMKDASDVIAGLTNETEQTALATDLFGSRFGAQLLPLLKEGSAGIEKLTDRAGELGLVMSTEAAQAAALFNDKMTELRGSLRYTAINIGNQLLPVVEPLITKFTEAVGKVSNWIKENKELTQTILKVGGVVAGMAISGGALLLFTSALGKVTLAVKGVSVALSFLAAHPVVAAGIGITALAGILALYIRRTKEAAKVTTEQLAKALDELKEMSETEKRIWKDRTETALKRIKEVLIPFVESKVAEHDATIKAGRATEQTNVFYLDAVKRLRELKQESKDLTEKLNALSASTKAGTGDLKGLVGQLTSGKLSTQQFKQKLMELGVTAKQVKEELLALPTDLKFLALPPGITEGMKEYASAAERIRSIFLNMEKLFKPPKTGLAGQYSKAARAELDRIQAASYELTHTAKEILDRQWAIEEERLRGLGLGARPEDKGLERKRLEEPIEKAKILHYAEYHKQRIALIDRQTEIEKQAIAEINQREQEAYQKELNRQEKLWEQGRDYHEKKNKQIAEYTERFETEQNKILTKFGKTLEEMTEMSKKTEEDKIFQAQQAADDYVDIWKKAYEEAGKSGSGGWGLPREYSPPTPGSEGPSMEQFQREWEKQEGKPWPYDDDTLQAPRAPTFNTDRFLPKLRRRTVLARPVITMPTPTIPIIPTGGVQGGGYVAPRSGRASGDVNVTIERIEMSFPNASLENMSAADFQRIMNTKIVPGIKQAAKNGLLNEVIL